MDWRKQWKVHPAADLFPMMSDAELDELGADIKANGLRQSLAVWAPPDEHYFDDMMLLDGRNRLAAMERAGLDIHPYGDDVRFDRVRSEDDPVAFVMSVNVRRRHLTREQKREMIVALLKLAPERSDRQVAKDVGVDHKTVGAARRAAEAGGEIPHLAERVGANGVAQPAPGAVARTDLRGERAAETRETVEHVRTARGDRAAIVRVQRPFTTSGGAELVRELWEAVWPDGARLWRDTRAELDVALAAEPWHVAEGHLKRAERAVAQALKAVAMVQWSAEVEDELGDKMLMEARFGQLETNVARLAAALAHAEPPAWTAPVGDGEAA